MKEDPWDGDPHPPVSLRGALEGPGLCGVCSHARIVGNQRGSRFYRCRLSEYRPGFPRYPVLPVVDCGGFERRDGFEDALPEERHAEQGGSDEGDDG